MSTFDEVEQATLLAVTNPNSPYFSKAMSDLRAAALEVILEAKKVDRIVLALLMEKKIEENLSIEEQMIRAQQSSKKYLEDYAAYQRDIYKQQIEDLHLDPKQLSDYLTKQNSKLEDEIEKLENRLAKLPAEQEAIKQEWDEMQENSRKELAAQLDGMSFTATDGTTRVLQESEINQLAAAAFNTSYDANKVIASVPGLSVADPVAQQEIAAKMSGHQAAMGQLRMLGAMVNMNDTQASSANNEERGVDNRAILKPSELRKMQEKNQPVADAGLKQITKLNDPAKKLYVKAINASEGCVKQQIDLAKDRLAENQKTLDKANKGELEADHAKTISRLPTPKPR